MTSGTSVCPRAAASSGRTRWAVLFVLGSLVTVGCGNDDPSAESIGRAVTTLAPDRHDADRPEADEIVYVEADWLPDDWMVGHVTERVGPPADYTLVWRPEAGAGSSRSDSTDSDSGPTIWANVGAAAYHGPQSYAALERFDLSAVEVVIEGDSLSLDFHLDCCVVALGARGVNADVLTRVAAGIRGVPRDEWRTSLGDRLLIDRG